MTIRKAQIIDFEAYKRRRFNDRLAGKILEMEGIINGEVFTPLLQGFIDTYKQLENKDEK